MRMPATQPRTLAEDLRGRSDDELADLLTMRPDLLHPIPSDMRALTTRAATAPSISRYLDDVDAIHHLCLRIACELSDSEPTSTDAIVKAATKELGPKARTTVKGAVDRLWTAALLWGTPQKVHVVTAVRDQVLGAPIPTWPPPACDHPPATPEHDVDAQAGLNARLLISVVEEVGGRWNRDPGVVLRSGGLATRAADALADSLEVERFDLTCAIETAHAAGLLAVGPTSDDLGWMPTEVFFTWCESSPERRWATLVRAWLNAPSISSDKPLDPQEHPLIVPWRRQLLTALDSAQGACDVSCVIDVVDFRWPRRAGAKRSATIETLWHEAEVLGVISSGRLSSIGRRAVQTDDVTSLAEAAKGHMVDEVDHVLVQADHTIVAPGPLVPSIGRRLREIADIESRGHATVLRITPTSVRRALETESDPQSWIDFLTAVATKELPQPISYVIADAARSAPGPRPTFTAPAGPKVRRRFHLRATPTTIDKAVRVLRAQEARGTIALVDESIDVPKMESATVVAQLRYSIDHHETVHLTHVESDGSIAVLLVDPIRLGGGSLTAYDHHAEQVRTLAVSRINGIATLQISA